MAVSYIRASGENLVIQIPKALALQLSLEEGMRVELVPSRRGLVVRALLSQRQWTLHELLSRCKGRNPHAEAWPERTGNERI